MVVEKLREGVVRFESLKYKMKAIGLLVFGTIVALFGVFYAFKSFFVGLVIFLVGAAMIAFSIFAFRSSRHTAEVKAGMHGVMSRRRLEKMEAGR